VDDFRTVDDNRSPARFCFISPHQRQENLPVGAKTGGRLRARFQPQSVTAGVEISHSIKEARSQEYVPRAVGGSILTLSIPISRTVTHAARHRIRCRASQSVVHDAGMNFRAARYVNGNCLTYVDHAILHGGVKAVNLRTF
jgi:hypothetical protein